MEPRQVVLTPAGLARIQEELRALRTRRPEVAEQIRQAKSLGDVTENAEYEQAKMDQALLERRIAELEDILGSATVIESAETPADTVGIGSVVTLQDLEGSEESEVTLVGSYEADPENDRISNECPIGEALLNRKIGETVEVTIPSGKARYKILSIRADG